MNRRAKFIRAVAELLTHNVMQKASLVRHGNMDSIKWATAYRAAGLGGETTADGAEKAIHELLNEEATVPYFTAEDVGQ